MFVARGNIRCHEQHALRQYGARRTRWILLGFAKLLAGGRRRGRRSLPQQRQRLADGCHDSLPIRRW